MKAPSVIGEFTNGYKFLSNFYSAPIYYKGILYPTVEHAYQAQKYVSKTKQGRFQWRFGISLIDYPNSAKYAGNSARLRTGWEEMKDDLMYTLVKLKFSKCLHLKKALLATGNAELREGNTWHDLYWGVSLKTGKGYNKLGKILMRVRKELRNTKPPHKN